MPIFLIGTLTFFAAMNAYLFWKVHQAFPTMGKLHYALAGALALLVFGPVLSRIVERAGHARLGSAMGLVVFSWLPIAAWFCMLAFAFDLWNIGVAAVAQWTDRTPVLLLRPRVLLAATGAIIAILTAWGLLEARSIRLNSFTVRTGKLPPGSPPIRVVLISDLHLAGGLSHGRLETAIRLIEEARPDVIVCTGDSLDSPADSLHEEAALLAALKPPLGKYSILGNHEHYAGLDNSEQFNREAGFTLLRGRSVQVSERLWIGGANDPASQYGYDGRQAEAPAGGEASPTRDPLPVPAPVGEGPAPYVILLKHRPTVERSSLGLFDLQLSGHTHGGQLFPFTLAISATEKYARGWYDVGELSRLYVSKGTGTWGPPMRLLAAPEVTLFIIEPAEPQ